MLILIYTGSFKVNSAVFEALIKSGALDSVGDYRIRMLAKKELFDSLTFKELESVIKINKPFLESIKILADDNSLEILKNQYKIRPPNSNRKIILRRLIQTYESSNLFDSKLQKIAWEKEYLGISLSGSESDIFNSRTKCVDIVNGFNGNFELSVCVDSIRKINTKKGDPMAFVTIRDNTYALDNLVVFPRQYALYEPLMKVGNVLRIKGKIDDRGSPIANYIEALT